MKKDAWLRLEKEEYEIEYNETLRKVFDKEDLTWADTDMVYDFVCAKCKHYYEHDYTINEIGWIIGIEEEGFVKRALKNAGVSL